MQTIWDITLNCPKSPCEGVSQKELMNNHEQNILEIKAIMQSFADAWNVYDAMQLAELFTEDADFINVAGQWWKGRTELVQGHANAFSNHLKNTQMHFPDTTVKFLKPDLAICHSTWEMSGLTRPDGTSLPTKYGVLSAIAQQDGQWQLVAVHNTETLSRNG
ncbi:hypothetical protein NIES4075_32930 [Tolypothrix sp. NIES-4075]|nr:hypothetical protein NIES4075_32930 [Tolypothrix sp. NIES-4075]